MARPRVSAAGGWAAIRYVFRKGREAGGVFKLYRKLRAKNACKTCALGMGGQRGGMVNEAGHFPEICKKSVQAQAADMSGAISEAFFAESPIAGLERLTPRECEELGRLAFPVVAGPGDTHFRRVGWDEALALVGERLAAADPDRTFFYASGRASNEAAYLLQLVARMYGTVHIHNCSYYCHSASGAALSRVYGSGTASLQLADLKETDFALVAGANPASNHPRLVVELVDVRRRGGVVAIVNPLVELGLTRFRIPSRVGSMLVASRVSDHYLQPRVSTDIALFKALLKGMVEKGYVNRAFVERHTTGWEAVEADVTAAGWDELLGACGVPRAKVDALVDAVGNAEKGIVLWSMGLTHQAHGTDSILALTNVALARGWLGRRGAGCMPIRGHSNVQGVGSVGMTPVLKAAFAKKMEEVYGIALPDATGQDTYASMQAADAGRIDASVLLGGNLWGSNPDSAWAGRALRRIPFTVSLTTKLNPGHFHGRGETTVILPVLARDEESQATTQESMFNFVRLSDGGEPNVEGEMRSEVEVIGAIAERVLPPGRFDWSAMRSHRRLREEIGKVVPGYGAISDIDDSRAEFQIDGRTFHEPVFATEDGRARFHVTPIPDLALPDGAFRLMTLRSEGQFNTVVYEEEDLYRGNRTRDVVMMSAADAARLGVAEGDPVRVENEVGALDVKVAIVDIAERSLAMYYPEANVLVPRALDARSKTPAFKGVVARVTTR